MEAEKVRVFSHSAIVVGSASIIGLKDHLGDTDGGIRQHWRVHWSTDGAYTVGAEGEALQPLQFRWACRPINCHHTPKRPRSDSKSPALSRSIGAAAKDLLWLTLENRRFHVGLTVAQHGSEHRKKKRSGCPSASSLTVRSSVTERGQPKEAGRRRGCATHRRN